MASSQIAPTKHGGPEGTEIYLNFAQDSRHESKKITELSRNLLIIVCEYLAFAQIVNMACSNRKIHDKLDNFLEASGEVSYFKRRAIIYFQNFFFQQFPSTDMFIKRISSITSCSTQASSSFLPLTKQSSLVVDKKNQLPQLSSSTSYNPFDLAAEMKSSRDLKANLLDKMEDQKSHNYIQETYMKWRGLYNKAIQNKQRFVRKSKSEFYSAFVQDPEDYARELFLDPSQCENPCFVLPKLTRENFTEKGLFYRTEKVLVQNYYNCFQKYSVDDTKKLLWDINQVQLCEVATNAHSARVMKRLLEDEGPQVRENQANLGYVTSELLSLTEPNAMLDMNTDQIMEEPDELDQLELALTSLSGLQRGQSKPSTYFDYIDFGINKIAMSGGSQDISELYQEILTYTLRQFKLICYAHKCQLDFLVQQIQMAPSCRQNYYIFIEDYVMKERNLRYLFRKISQNYIVQDSFQETMLRQKVFEQSLTGQYPYLCDFLLLEFMDSIWINEVYRPHSHNVIQILKQEVQNVHCLERFEELGEKKEFFRKMINIIHQTEFNLSTNACFLSMSLSEHRSLGGKSDGEGAAMNRYEDLSASLNQSLRTLLKQMQQSSQTVQEYIDLCNHYEAYQFHKIQEVESYYLQTKKYYLGKAFANELGIKLENNKYSRASGASCGSASTASTSSPSPFGELSLTQVIPPDLTDGFFHQLIRRLLKDETLKQFLDTEQLLSALFILFHIEQVSTSQFASEIGQHLTECHSQIDELIHQQPELASQFGNEEEKKDSQLQTTDGQPTPGASQSCPFTFNASDEDEDWLGSLTSPDLNRGYSDQKRMYQKGLRRTIFRNFRSLEAQFDFNNLILQRRQSDKKRLMDEIQQRIDNFNQAMLPYNNSQSQVDDAGVDLEDEEMLPDPSQLFAAFTGQPAAALGNGLNLPSLQRSNNSYSYHISSSQVSTGRQDPTTFQL